MQPATAVSGYGQTVPSGQTASLWWWGRMVGRIQAYVSLHIRSKGTESANRRFSSHQANPLEFDKQKQLEPLAWLSIMFHHSTFDAIQIVVKTLEAQPILQTQVRCCLPSFTTGCPCCARWTRIWCLRPVTIDTLHVQPCAGVSTSPVLCESCKYEIASLSLGLFPNT